MEKELKCPLPNCKYIAPNGTGFSAHKRSHVLRGEATSDDKGRTITPTGIPLAITPAERKKRMEDIKAGRIEAQFKLPKKKSTEIVKHKHPAAPNRPTIDISKFTPDQIDELRVQLNGHDAELIDQHSCPTTRAIDRLKEAVVLNTVAEMLDTTPPDQLLVMISSMRRLGPLPASRR